MKTTNFMISLFLIFVFVSCSANKVTKKQKHTKTVTYTSVAKSFVLPKSITFKQNSDMADKSLFNCFIATRYYKIKPGMTISRVKLLLKNQKYVSLSKKQIRQMVIKKFKLLNTAYNYADEYATALSRIASLDILATGYNGKKLLLFFFNKKLYSIKLRYEKSTERQMYLVLRTLINTLKHGETMVNQNNATVRKIIAYKRHGRKLEFHHYKTDNSSELTYYDKGLLNKLQKLVNVKVKKIIAANKKSNSLVRR